MSLCLRRGYQCKCEQCKPWIERWDKELEAFADMVAAVDRMIEEGKSLFHIYEFLSCNHPDMIRLHYDFIEKHYIDNKVNLLDD